MKHLKITWYCWLYNGSNVNTESCISYGWIVLCVNLILKPSSFQRFTACRCSYWPYTRLWSLFYIPHMFFSIFLMLVFPPECKPSFVFARVFRHKSDWKAVHEFTQERRGKISYAGIILENIPMALEWKVENMKVKVGKQIKGTVCCLQL